MYSCKSCNHKILPFFNLGQMPSVNKFLSKADTKKTEKKYKLEVAFCPNCFLTQLTETIPPDDLYTDYIYFSSISQSILSHAEQTANELINQLKLKTSDLVLEVASNDGYLLQYFQKKNINVLGVDPAENIAKVANERGIETIADFFNFDLAKKLAKRGIQPKLIYGANVLAHVPEIRDFIKGVAHLLPKSGVAVFEFPYISGLFEGKFDTIYHEHVFYYSLVALRNMFQQEGLKVYDCDFTKMQGGSLRIFVGHQQIVKDTQRCLDLITREQELGYTQINTYFKIKIKAETLKNDLTNLLERIKTEGKTVGAYAAPAKGVVLLNYFDISKYLNLIVDKAPQKQGLYVPGIHLLVKHPNAIYAEKPNYLIILSWNIADEVMKEHQAYKKVGGKFIIPIPTVEIL